MTASSTMRTRTATVVLAAVAALLLHASVPAAAADCTAYAPYYPYSQTTTQCVVTDMCYTRNLCCPSASTTDLDTCLDTTTYTCNFTSVCEAHAGDSTWFPHTSDGGATVSCCQSSTSATTTPPPFVPGFGGSSDTYDSSKVGPLPSVTCDDDTTAACAVTSQFPSLIRAFCKDAIPSTYGDAYLLQSASNMCCKYAAAPSSTSSLVSKVGSTGCGTSLLDLPRVGEFHCSLQGRAKTICCNGRLNPLLSSTSSSSSSSVNESLEMGDSYTYLNDTCLYVPQSGDGVARGAVVTVPLVAALVAALMVALQ